MRILVYGGSFNPPHKGHIRAAKLASEFLQPDRILIVPASIPPHKALAEASPTAEERLALARLAFDEVPGAEVTDLEIRRPGASYTVDTLRAIADANSGAELYFLMGTDMLLYMEQWYSFREIFALCRIAVLSREDGDVEELRSFAAYLRNSYAADIEIIPCKALPMNSTSLRHDLHERGGLDRLPEDVYEEIIRCRYYGAQPDLNWLWSATEPFLKKKRIAHVRGCSELCRSMAERWGEDPDLACEAGILHDITKRMDTEEQLLLCEKYGIIPDAYERSEPKLLHALTGAPFSRERFGVSDAVYDAIRWHTTGRPDMTTLEKILYLADMIEPTRTFEGVEALRVKAELDLDTAVAAALRQSLDHLERNGATIHPLTAAACEWYEAAVRKTKAE